MGIFVRFIKSLRKKEAPQEKIVKTSSPVSASAVVAPARSFSRLRQDGESYYFTNTVPYHEDRSFREDTVEKVLSFAYPISPPPTFVMSSPTLFCAPASRSPARSTPRVI